MFSRRKLAQSRGPQLAEVVLVAADSFEAMLSAYQRGIEPPATEPLHALIRALLQSSAPASRTTSAPQEVPR